MLLAIVGKLRAEQHISLGNATARSEDHRQRDPPLVAKCGRRQAGREGENDPEFFSLVDQFGFGKNEKE